MSKRQSRTYREDQALSLLLTLQGGCPYPQGQQKQQAVPRSHSHVGKQARLAPGPYTREP